MEHNEEYEKHYSPDGERIEYLMEHPEENNQPIEEKWKEKFNNRFDIGPILLKSGGVRISALYGPEEIISFIENLLEQERKKLVKQIDSFPLSDSMFFDENNWSEIRKVARFISMLQGRL